MKVEFYKHNVQERDIENVVKSLRSLFLTTGDVVADFEGNLSSYLGCQHTVGVTSCTAALHLCLLAFGIGPGDEVITTPMTFIATANAILYTGATPVFVDVEKETGNMDASQCAPTPIALTASLWDVSSGSRCARSHWRTTSAIRPPPTTITLTAPH